MASSIKLPRRLPLLIIDGVLFPGASIRIPVTSYRKWVTIVFVLFWSKYWWKTSLTNSMNMVKSHLLSRSTLSSAIIGVVPKEEGSHDTKEEDKTCMHEVGTAGIVVQVTGTNWPRPAYTLLVTGLCRFRLDSLAQESPYLVGVVRQLDKLPGEDMGMSVASSWRPILTLWFLQITVKIFLQNWMIWWNSLGNRLPDW